MSNVKPNPGFPGWLGFSSSGCGSSSISREGQREMMMRPHDNLLSLRSASTLTAQVLKM